MNISSASSLQIQLPVQPQAPSQVQPRAVSVEQRPELARKTKDEMMAAYRAEHPRLTPQQAFASGAELGPPSGGPRDDNQASKVHTEIKVNGKVVARTYNSGAVEIANEYGFLADELGFGGDTGSGPDLAKERAARINAALERYGAVTKDDKLSPDDLASALQAKLPIVELLLSDTAQTQQEWLDDMEKEGRLEPGMLFSQLA